MWHKAAKEVKLKAARKSVMERMVLEFQKHFPTLIKPFCSDCPFLCPRECAYSKRATPRLLNRPHLVYSSDSCSGQYRARSLKSLAHLLWLTPAAFKTKRNNKNTGKKSHLNKVCLRTPSQPQLDQGNGIEDFY